MEATQTEIECLLLRLDSNMLKKRSKNLQNKPSGSNDADLQELNKNFVSDKNKEAMVHNGGSAQQLEKCSAGHKCSAEGNKFCCT